MNHQFTHHYSHFKKSHRAYRSLWKKLPTAVISHNFHLSQTENLTPHPYMLPVFLQKLLFPLNPQRVFSLLSPANQKVILLLGRPLLPDTPQVPMPEVETNTTPNINAFNS